MQVIVWTGTQATPGKRPKKVSCSAYLNRSNIESGRRNPVDSGSKWSSFMTERLTEGEGVLNYQMTIIQIKSGATHDTAYRYVEIER